MLLGTQAQSSKREIFTAPVSNLRYQVLSHSFIKGKGHISEGLENEDVKNRERKLWIKQVDRLKKVRRAV